MSKRGAALSLPAQAEPLRAPAPTVKTKKPLHVQIDEDVYKVLSIRCSHDGRTLSEVACQAIREWLKAQPPMRPVPNL